MTHESGSQDADTIIATIENQNDPDQSITIKYQRDKEAFITAGIQTYFGEKEILIPSHLAVTDFQLVGTIVSAILEELSQAQEMETTFNYSPEFTVMDRAYTLTEREGYMELAIIE